MPWYLLDDFRNFNEIFRKALTYDNIQSHKKAMLHSLFKKYYLGKTKGKGQIDPPAVLGLKNLDLEKENFTSFKQLSLSVPDQYPTLFKQTISKSINGTVKIKK